MCLVAFLSTQTTGEATLTRSKLSGSIIEALGCSNHIPERDRLCTLLFDFSPGAGDAFRGTVGREEVLELFALLFTAAEAAELLLVDGIVKLMDTKRSRRLIKRQELIVWGWCVLWQVRTSRLDLLKNIERKKVSG